jgi:O-antigen ligase
MKFGLSVALFGAGVMLLMLTFSRSAWLGLATGASFVFFRRDRFEPRRLFAIGLAALIAGLVVLVPLAQILVTRLTGAVSAQTFNPESTSVVTRYYMMFEAGRLIEAYPVFGSGAGTFVAALARLLPPYFSVEPVHNLFLLAFEELGIPGALITVTVAAWALLAVWRARSPAAILSGALVLALFVTTLFDHYLWTLPPMRTVLWLSLGLILAEPARGEAQASSSALEVSSSEAHG